MALIQKQAAEKREAEARERAHKADQERYQREQQHLQEVAEKSLTLEEKYDVWVLDEDGHLFCNGQRYLRPGIGPIKAFSVIPKK